MAYLEGNWHTKIIASHAQALYTMQGTLDYMEIGVRSGSTFNAVLPHTTYALAVDIADVSAHLYGGDFVHASSDDFFAQYDEERRFDIIFIDGLHTSEQVGKDFENALPLLKPNGYIYLHDTWPNEAANSGEELCGDVWKFAEEVESRFNRCMTFQAFPGLTVVQPNPRDRGL